MLMDRTNFPQARWLLQFRVKNLSLGSGGVDQRGRTPFLDTEIPQELHAEGESSKRNVHP